MYRGPEKGRYRPSFMSRNRNKEPENRSSQVWQNKGDQGAIFFLFFFSFSYFADCLGTAFGCCVAQIFFLLQCSEAKGDQKWDRSVEIGMRDVMTTRVLLEVWSAS